MAEVEAKLSAADEDFFAVAIQSECGASRVQLDRLEAARNAGTLGAPFYVLRDVEERWLQEHLEVFWGWPTVFFVASGSVVDMAPGAQDEAALRSFVARNLDPAEPRVLVEVDLRDAEALRQRLKLGAIRRMTSLVDADLREIRLRRVDLSGSDLSGADLSGATLTEVILSRADLTDARFGAATLDRVFWGATVCPDGSYSAAQGFTCDGHLLAQTVAPQEDKARDEQMKDACRKRFEVPKTLSTDEYDWQVKRETLRCSTGVAADVLYEDEWQSLDEHHVAEMASQLDKRDAQQLLGDGCRFDYLPTAPGQRDAYMGLLLADCGGDTHVFYRFGGQSHE